VQSGWNAAVPGGDAIGCLIASFLLNKIGRKPVIWIGCVFNIVGIGLQQASHEWKLFLVGRFINAMGFAIVFIFSPVWYASSILFDIRIGELAPPELRGLFLCLQNGSIVLGQFIMVYIPSQNGNSC
jgi:MFS family permease